MTVHDTTTEAEELTAPSRGGGQTWKWRRTSATQRSLLDAAREVFVEHGFTNTNISDIVARAGSSVGSLYHHFGGKSELFIALWQEYHNATVERASNAVQAARERGADDPAELYLAGTRTVLEGCWQNRDLSQLFSSGDGPPGFELLRRRNSKGWINRNDVLLGLRGDQYDQLFTSLLQGVVAAATREVANSANKRDADTVITAAIEYLQRLMTGGPWRPPEAPRRTRRAKS